MAKKYAVIFRAEIDQFEEGYTTVARKLRSIALNEYGCTEFVALTEGSQEVAISYWSSLEQIKAWKQHPEHLKAQRLGKSKWYQSYQVQIVEILREYHASKENKLEHKETLLDQT